MKNTKANLRWMDHNQDKLNILKQHNLNDDTLRIVARYIGSKNNDKREVCKCGNILSVKQTKIIKSSCKCDKCNNTCCFKCQKNINIKNALKLYKHYV